MNNSSPLDNMPWHKRLLRKFFTSEPQSRNELIEILHSANRSELISTEALLMMEGALKVSAAMHVRDVMVPRGQMVVAPYDARPDEIIPMIIESGHSRFPVVSDTRDEVQGILLAKDLLEYLFRQTNHQNANQAFNIRDFLRPATFIPDSKRLNVLLREFRTNRNHMAVVVDEYGGAAGLVTIEDVIEEIVGRIDDEHDSAGAVYIKRREQGYFTVNALTPLETFNEYFETDFNLEEFDTVGGILMSAFGHMPENGEQKLLSELGYSYKKGDLQFKILRANKRRIVAIRVTPLANTPKEK